MKLGKFVCVIMVLCSSAPGHAADQPSQVMAPVHQFFAALGRQDKSGMLAVVAEHVEITSLKQGELRRLDITRLADAIASHRGGAIAEHIHHPVVQIDHDLAVVWAPYTFTIDGRVDHCGTDVLTLGKLGGDWLIIGLSDNERKRNCPSS